MHADHEVSSYSDLVSLSAVGTGRGRLDEELLERRPEPAERLDEQLVDARAEADSGAVLGLHRVSGCT